MNSPLEISFWVNFIYFFAAIFIALYIPGFLLIRKLKLNFLNQVVLSIATGLVLLSLQGFLFGYLHLRTASYFYVFFCLILFIKLLPHNKIRLAIKHVKFSKPDIITSLIIIVGTFIQLTSVWFNGIKFKDGLYFCCGLPDTLFHLALTNELVNRFPPNEPGISGVTLQNYHFLSNLSVSELIRIFNLPLINTEYQYMTILLSLLLGLSALVLANILELGTIFKRWFVFLIYFAGDILFLLPFLNGKGINFGITTLENASSLWISPPRFYSIVIFISALSVFALWLKRKDYLSGLIMAILIGSLAGFKVYVGAIALFGLGVLAIKYLFQKNFKMLIPIILAFLISFLIYYPVNKSAGGLIFSGFWRFEDFAVQPLLGMSALELARRVYLDHKNLLRVLEYDLIFGFLYIFFSAGILILGIIQTRNSLKKLLTDFNIMAISGLFISCIFGFFFLQKTGGANSSQFLISIYIIGSIYTALAISYWTKRVNRKLALILILLIILITSTRVMHDTFFKIQNITNRTGFILNNNKLNSYKYFARLSNNNIVLTSGELGSDCIFINFIGNKPTFDCNIGAPMDRNVDLSKKIKIKQYIFSNYDAVKRKQLVLTNNISYIYVSNEKQIQDNIKSLGFIKLYQNSSSVIYKVN
jgi:hypothetical protein